MREAAINGRTLHAEILHRLQVSLQGQTGAHREPASGTLHNAHEQAKSPAELLTELDRAMLSVYRRMPPEKQLALLSLFR